MLPRPLAYLLLHTQSFSLVTSSIAYPYPYNYPALYISCQLHVIGRPEASIWHLHHPRLWVGGRCPRLTNPLSPLWLLLLPLLGCLHLLKILYPPLNPLP